MIFRNIKIRNNHQVFFSNTTNKSFTTYAMLKKPVSLFLEKLLKAYFHPYQFIISNTFQNTPPLKDFSSLLFNADLAKSNNGNFNYKVTPIYDPVITLLREITKENIPEHGFKIIPIEKENLSIFSPKTFLPMHFSLRIRDAMEEQNVQTITQLESLNMKSKEKIIADPFQFELNLDKIFDSKIPNHNLRKSLEEEKIQNQMRINNIINCWNKLSEIEQQRILDDFFHNYYRAYIVGPNHNNTINFTVHDKNWDLASFLPQNLTDPKNDINTAVRLIKSSQYRHSSVCGYTISCTSGGALWINTFCPGIQFLKSLDYSTFIGDPVNIAMRHDLSCNRDKPIDSHEYYSDNLYPFNGFIPYWMVIYLKETCDAFGIKNSGLTFPCEMQREYGNGFRN